MKFRQTGALFCTCVALMLAPSLRATTVIAPPFETLVDAAELIFSGQVISQRSEWRNIDGKKSIVTLITVGVQQVHKGRAGNTVTLQFLGGTIGDTTLDVAEMPHFKNGERVVLFVANNGAAVSPILGFFHGRFSVRKGADGRDEVVQHDGQPLIATAEIGRAKAKGTTASKQGLTPDDFSRKIRERAARGPAKP
jgi:hypothetical protein